MGRGRFIRSADNRLLGWETDHGAAWLDRERKRLSGGWDAANRLSQFERGKPLFYLLVTWQRDLGVQTVHAGLVSKGGRGVLLPGFSGIGKTTSALSCIPAGFQFLGDDHVGLECKAGKWIGYSMYGSACVEPPHLKRLAGLQFDVADGPPPPDDKRVVFLDGGEDRLAKSTTIEIIAIPRLCDSEYSTYQTASKAEAYRALSLGTLSGVKPRPSPWCLGELAALVDRVPCVWLNLGSRLADIPRCIDSLLEEHAPR